MYLKEAFCTSYLKLEKFNFKKKKETWAFFLEKEFGAKKIY